MLTVHDALLQGTKLFEEGAICAPRLTAEVLLCHALKRERAYLYAHPEEPLAEVAWIHYGRYLKERLDGKPTQYITKRQEFYGREFHVNSDVLIPRPETEHLVECAIKIIRPGDLVVDIGTGSGAIAISLALETQARVLGSDISGPALAVAQANGARLGASVGWLRADLAKTLAPGSLNLLVSNPPYVPRVDEPGLQREVRDWEPHLALFAGPTGLENYERLIEDAARVLKPGGWLAMELGYNSLEQIQAMLSAGWRHIEVTHDLAGFPRVIVCQLAQ